MTEKLTAVDKHNCRLQLVDTASSNKRATRYKAQLSQWIEGAQAVVLVYSVTSQRSFTKVGIINDLVLQLAPNLPRVLVGNKTDATEARQVDYLEGYWKYQELRCCGFFEVSAKTGANVDKPFHYLVRALRLRTNPLLVPGVVPRPMSQVSIQQAVIRPLQRGSRHRLRHETRRLDDGCGLPPITPPPSPAPIGMNDAAMQVGGVIKRPNPVVLPDPLMIPDLPMPASPVMAYSLIAPPSPAVHPGPFFTQEGSIIQSYSGDSVMCAESLAKVNSVDATASVETFHSVFEYGDDDNDNRRFCGLCRMWTLVCNAVVNIWTIMCSAISYACASTSKAATKAWGNTRRTIASALADITVAYVDFLVWLVIKASRLGIPFPYFFIFSFPPFSSLSFRFPAFRSPCCHFTCFGRAKNQRASNNREASTNQETTNTQSGTTYQIGANYEWSAAAVEMV